MHCCVCLCIQRWMSAALLLLLQSSPAPPPRSKDANKVRLRGVGGWGRGRWNIKDDARSRQNKWPRVWSVSGGVRSGATRRYFTETGLSGPNHERAVCPHPITPHTPPSWQLGRVSSTCWFTIGQMRHTHTKPAFKSFLKLSSEMLSSKTGELTY